LLKPQDIAGWQPTNKNFEAVACPHKEFSFREQTALLRQVNGLKADLVHFTFAQQPVLYRGRKVTTIHDLTTLRFGNPDKNRVIFKIKQQVYKYVIKTVSRKSTEVLTISEFVKNDLVKFSGISADKVTVTYEAADLATDKPEPLPALTDKKFIMYVGRPTPHKNLERLIEAFIKLKANHPGIILVLAGKKDANYRRIESEVAQRTIKNVVFTDFVTEGRLRWLYENCSAYVFPSLSEGFGLPGLEAMAHGAPVVSSNATCLPEVYGDAAHYFDPMDIQSIADAIDEVLTDKELRLKLTKEGHEQASKYSWRRMAEQTVATYQKAVRS
jgi:glycosyltransferase involved in cell wall biosynthesis